MYSKRSIHILIALFVILFTNGCSMVYDDLAYCPTGVHLHFFTKTPCDATEKELGEVSSLHIFVFDDNDRLVWKDKVGTVQITKDYELTIPLRGGKYTIYAWSGIDDRLDLADLKPGVTTPESVLLSVKKEGEMASDLRGLVLREGESKTVVIPDAAIVGTDFQDVSINLQEKTNRINVTLDLHESIRENAVPEDFAVEIRSANRTHRVDGQLPYDQEQVGYPTTFTYTETTVSGSFVLPTILSGHNSILRIYNKKTNDTIWEGDLMANLLMKGQNVNLDCERDYNLRFDIRDKCLECHTYICWAIVLNDWVIHSYQVALDNDIL